ncbi:MFS transporter [Actinomycetospora sp. NBRC 106378]|uniref:MFS transporter n=1 Tax=Actinomycetospora sp. NBRC 106378 TaxID=3032208 RepID=UPI0024A0CE6E|nr:MFS transporter [Actinomycetospora sp. NBRC 106378]GLZ51897.1 MFS transporter [Actinomycetospora sp. NBRC 106378]
MTADGADPTGEGQGDAARGGLVARVRRWVPPHATGRRLLVAALVDSTGTGLYLATSALFLTRTIGLSPVEVGIGVSAGGVGGLLGTVPVGRLADRVGARPVLVALYLLRGVCFAALPFLHGPVGFVALSFVIGVAEWSGGPLVQSLVGATDDGADRVTTMAAVFSVRNIGFTVGALLAGIAVTAGDTGTFTVLVLLDAASFVVTAALLTRLDVPPAGARAGAPPLPRGAWRRAWNPRLLALTGLNGVLYLHTILLGVVLPLWITTRTAAPPAMIAVLVVVNTVIAVVLQVPLSRGLDSAPAAAHRQLRAGLSLAGCCLLAAAAAWTGALAAAVLIVAVAVVLSLGEIWQGAGAWRLSFALAPPAERSYYLGIYELGISAASAVGPALLTWAVLDDGGGTLGWVVLAAVFAVTGPAVVAVTRGLPTHLEDQEATT